MEREKLEKAVLQRVAGGASIEAAAKEFKVTEKLVYTWLTIAHLEKGAECMREREAEEAIIDQFFRECKKQRAKDILGNEKQENEIFNNMVDRQLNPKKKHSVKDPGASTESVFKEMEKRTKCKECYIFSRELKGRVQVEDLYKLDMLVLQEEIVSFGKCAYFQHEEAEGGRMRWVLF